MPWADGVLLLLLAAFAANGTFLGLIRQLAALVGLLLGLTLAILFYQPLAGILVRIIPRLPPEATAFVLILFGVWIAAHLAAYLATALRPRAADSDADADGLDVASGALFGLLTGILMLSILVTGVVWLGLPTARALRQSYLGGWLLDVGAWLAGLLSAWLPIPWAS